jgi:hypothetical protein
MDSSVLGRKLCGILQSGLWHDLQRREPLPAAALVTDIGNDLVYGASAEQTLEWVEACVAQLRPHVERLVITLLPIDNLEALGQQSFVFFRTLLFPRSRLTLDAALQRTHQINERLVGFAGRYRAYVIRPQTEWYGMDPIHVMRRRYPQVWQRVFTCWCDGRIPDAGRAGISTWWRYRRLRPLERRWFGMLQRCPQPALRTPHGMQISLY